jgi:lipoate-protein ligase A
MLRKIISHSTDPFTNLSLEHFIFKQSIKTILIYRNNPSIILGKNQSIFKEINIKKALELGVLIARRESGGGAVYHELGNTNYFYTHSGSSKGQNLPLFDKKLAVDLIRKALNNLNIPALLSNRNDILLHGKKISGTAYKITNKNQFTHGINRITRDNVD